MALSEATPVETRPSEAARLSGTQLSGARLSEARLSEARWERWSTTVVLRVLDPRGRRAARVAVERELDAIELACSRFRPDSEIARVNSAGGRAVRVSSLFAEALTLALRAAATTEGDVDPTVGCALALAGYDRDWRLLEPAPAAASTERPDDISPPCPDAPMRRRSAVPTLRARRLAGWRAVELDRARATLRVPAGVQLDVGATAKAWAADRGAQAAARAAGCGVLLAIGGDIATCGPAPARGWAIHVTDDHRADHRAAGQTVTIRSGGLATSSKAVRRWRQHGRTMHHLIDPASGAPVRATWRTVSVAAASCADANIATTAALVRAAAAPAWLAGLGVPARLVSESGRVYTLGAWPLDGGSEWPHGPGWPAGRGETSAR